MVMTINNQVKTGKILIAEPFMLDPHFKRSVVLITDHNVNGDMGFILNKTLDVRLNDVMVGFPEFNAPLFYGGPVATNSVQYVHNVGDLLEGSTRVSSGVYWGGSWDNLKFLIEAKLIEPKHIRFFVGYSSWEEGQLINEMNESSWIISDMHSNYLFNAQPNTLWRTVLQHKGEAFSIIADMPDDNNIN